MDIDFHGLDLIRGRDCIVFVKGSAQTVTVSSAMLQGGWVGGQGVQWAAGATDDLLVTYSTGLFGGFMIWGSSETADQYTSMTGQPQKYGHSVMLYGENLISTIAYERYTYASRLAGPLVPLTYTASEPLYFSLRGYWTKEDEMTLSGNPLAPAVSAGFVAQLPKSNNSFWLGVQTSL